MACVRPKAETNSQYYRLKHLVHYINLTPFIGNNTAHTCIYIYTNERVCLCVCGMRVGNE